MAKRIATEYINTKFQLTSNELSAFISFMEEQQIRLQILVLENGNQALRLQDELNHEEIRMTFERQQDKYVCEMSCRLIQPKLTNAMRRAVSAFRGNAIVNRIYSHYTMIYHYKDGLVHLIMELTENGERVVFEKKSTLLQLQRVFQSRLVEREIDLLQHAVNELLDLRNQSTTDEDIARIDNRLTELTQKLFVLEA